jgi:DNA invertase Pin-like site-specific DNA recombinase
MTTFDIYARISQEGDRTSAQVEEQLDLYEATCREWAEQHGFEVGEVACESNVAGSTKVEDRKLGELIRRVEDGESAGIVTPYLDRFGRDQIEGCVALRRITQSGGRLVCVSDGFDSAAPGSKLIFQMRMAIAEDYLDRVNANFNAKIERAAERGVYFGGRPPAGYDRDADGKVTPHPKAKAIIREAFKRRAQGATIDSIRDFLHVKGAAIETRDERKPEAKQAARPFAGISMTGVRHLLRNRAYVGESRSRTERRGQVRVMRTHDALISDAEWEAAQAAGGPYHPKNGRWAGSVRLAGLVYCPNGHRLKVGSAAIGGKPGARVASYLCTHAECNARAGIQAERLDTFVSNLLMQAVVSEVPEVIAVLRGDDRYRRAMEAVEAARVELETYVAEVRVSDVGREAWVLGKDARQSALDAARAELRATPAPQPVGGRRNGKAVSFEEALPSLERDELARFIDRVVVRPVGVGRRVPVADRVEVYFVGAEDAADLRLAAPAAGEIPVGAAA